MKKQVNMQIQAKKNGFFIGFKTEADDGHSIEWVWIRQDDFLQALYLKKRINFVSDGKTFGEIAGLEDGSILIKTFFLKTAYVTAVTSEVKGFKRLFTIPANIVGKIVEAKERDKIKFLYHHEEERLFSNEDKLIWG